MIDRKISELTELTTPAAGDLLAIVDISEDETKRITESSLLSGVVNTIRVITTYTALMTDYVIFADTDGGDFTLTLPAGVEGKMFRIINCGSSGNTLTIDGDGAETVMGALTQLLADGEIVILTYNATEGWW